MAGYLLYRDTTHLSNAEWNMLDVSELIDLNYVDEVYKPAVFSCTIQNVSAGGGLSQSSVAHDGGDGSSTDGELIVTKSGHGLVTGDRVTVSNESTEEVIPRIYEVEKIDSSTFYLQHFTINPWSNQKHTGSAVTRIVGNGSGGTLSYVPTGKYSVEAISVANPDFTMGQEVIYCHMPEKFTKGGPFNHDGQSPLVVSSVGHGHTAGKLIQIVNESTGALPDGTYQISDPNADDYKLRHIKNYTEYNGNGTGGTIRTILESTIEQAYPLFYGTITNLEETWTPSYGKVIKLQAKDHLQFFSNTTVKKIQKKFRTTGEKIGSPNQEQGESYRIGAGLKAPVYLDGKKLNDAGDAVSENKISDAIGNMVDDFNEGSATIYTDNLAGQISSSGTSSLGNKKFEDSGFNMTGNELLSGQFKRDLSDSGHRVLRAMQEMAMSDRHVTASGTGSAPGTTWAASGAAQPIIVTSGGHGLATGQMIAVSDSTTSGTMRVPNGYYNVTYIATDTFYLNTLDGTRITNSHSSSANGTLSWEGAEDGNFGYDFFLDSGIYGAMTSEGYTLAGNAYYNDPRPHLNYFKRGYRQFRPDATSLNIVSPVEEDVEETGQIKIMYPNAQWKIGDDEVISDVELQITGGDAGNTDKSELGHNLQLLRVKKIQCCNNVDAFTDRNQRLNHAGRWNGEFHWNRHDSFVAKDITDATQKHETLVKANDEGMFTESGGSLTNPGFYSAGTGDISSDWQMSEAGDAADNWGATAGVPLGSVQDREILRRVIDNGMGGVGTIVVGKSRVASGTAPGGAYRICGYAGPSQVPIVGRPLNKGPGDQAVVERTTDDHTASGGSAEFKHTYPHYATGIVDCDLIKSIKNCELEGLIEPNDVAAYCTVENDGGDMLVSHITSDGADPSRHDLQTGAIIKITGGNSYDSTNYWNNYKRVVVPLPPAGWTPIASDASGTLKVNIAYNTTSIVLESGDGSGFPSAYFLIRVGSSSADYETMWCTSRSTDTLTVVRAEIKSSEWGGGTRSHTGSDSGTGAPVVLDRTSYNIVGGSGTSQSYLNSKKFYLTDLPNEAYDGIPGTVPTAGALSNMAYAAGGVTNYKRVFNVFDGVARVQYQSINTRNEDANTDSYVLISDRARMDIPYVGVEVYAVADEDRISSTAELSGLTTGAATMPDSRNYAGTVSGTSASMGLLGGVGRKIDGKSAYNVMPVRFRRGDKISETRFLMRDEATSTCKHLFKNTQAIITQALMEDKKRAKTQSLTYAESGNDFNEVRRTAASSLTRASKDLLRGTCKILGYPVITLTGEAGSGSTGAALKPTQNLAAYGGRAGMLVTKTNGLDGTHQAGVLAEHLNDAGGTVTGTLYTSNLATTATWSTSPTTYYRIYIHLRAGHSVRVSDPLSGVAANTIITKLSFKESAFNTSTDIEVIGYQDLPSGVPIRPLGNITKAVVENKGDLDGPITLGKARLNEITFSSGDPP